MFALTLTICSLPLTAAENYSGMTLLDPIDGAIPVVFIFPILILRTSKSNNGWWSKNNPRVRNT